MWYLEAISCSRFIFTSRPPPSPPSANVGGRECSAGEGVGGWGWGGGEGWEFQPLWAFFFWGVGRLGFY